MTKRETLDILNGLFAPIEARAYSPKIPKAAAYERVMQQRREEAQRMTAFYEVISANEAHHARYAPATWRVNVAGRYIPSASERVYIDGRAAPPATVNPSLEDRLAQSRAAIATNAQTASRIMRLLHGW